VRLRATFNEAAELYDRARPGYPSRMFDELADLVELAPGCRVLEIGCGTGQATMPLAKRGCQIVAVEVGAEMAGVARRNLARFPSVQVVTSASATAFHWLDPVVSVVKSADALRIGGVLATVATHHVAGGTEEFFVEVQDCYVRFDPATSAALRLPTPADIPEADGELIRSGRFGRRPAGLHQRCDRHPPRRAGGEAVPDRAAGRPTARLTCWKLLDLYGDRP
jgi:SAM-dependent methyltransferase